ncbi:MAG: hypothetical protein GX891_00770, partial [Clostridiales bacterium]|nr:hypothetical protein [Clostridiales bacterium]
GIYDVAVQAVAPSSSSQEGATSDDYAILRSRAESVSAALADIGQKTGMSVTLAHCNALFLTPPALINNPAELFETLMHAWLLPPHAIIVAVEDKPDEILSSKHLTSTDMSEHVFQLLRSTENSQDLTRCTINYFLVDFYSESCVNNIPLATLKRVEEDSETSKEPTCGEYYLLDLRKNLIVGTSSYAIVDERCAKGINMIFSDLKYYPLVFKHDNINLDFAVIKSKSKVKLEEKTLKVKTKATIALREITAIEGEVPYVDISQLDVYTAVASEEFKSIIKYAFDKSKELNLDFLGIKNIYYQETGERLESDDFLKDFTIEPEIELEIQKAVKFGQKKISLTSFIN